MPLLPNLLPLKSLPTITKVKFSLSFSLQLCSQWKKLQVPRSCIHHINHNAQTRSIAKQGVLHTSSTYRNMDNISTILSFNN